jgi:hypothetical protein
MQWMGLMMICCKTALKGLGMFGVSVRKLKALTVKMETVTLIDKGRQNLTCLVYGVYEFNNTIFYFWRPS